MDIIEKETRVEVSALLALDKVTVAAVGGILELRSGSKLLSKIRVFKGSRIHGLVQDPRDPFKVLVFGAKTIGIVRIDPAQIHVLQEPRSCQDWIIAVAWTSDPDAILILTAHNQVLKFDLSTGQSLKTWICQDKCILYSGTVVTPSVILAGTVFTEIVIWNCDNDGQECQVLHRLRGHEGVIFSLNFNHQRNLILSTSDDRTARLWSVEFDPALPQCWAKAKITAKQVFRDHQSRVFRGLILTDKVVTAGEDSFISTYDCNGLLLSQVKSHNGSPVWALCSDSGGDHVISGGGDGSIKQWPLTEPTDAEAVQVDLDEALGNPRVVVLFDDFILILTDQGCLFCSKTGETKMLLQDESLGSYGLMGISSKKRLITASLDGVIQAFQLTTSLDQNDLFINTDWPKRSIQVFQGKIFSLHALKRQEIFLICGPGGKMITFNDDLNVLHNFDLPQTGNQHFVSSALWINDSLFVGDRNGHLHLYRHGQPSPVQSLAKVHGRHGIGCIRFQNQLLTTAGRDGVIKSFNFEDSTGGLEELASSRSSVPTMERFMKIRDHSDLVLGFKSSSFVVQDLKQNQQVLEVNCGGGHRSWDFNVHGNGVNFVFVKDKRVYFKHVQIEKCFAKDLKEPLHARSISVVSHFVLKSNHYLVTAGEDVVIKIHTQMNDSFRCVNVLTSHISSVKSIKTVIISKDKVLMVSAGGRAQIKAWIIQQPLDEGELLVSEVASHLLKGSDKQRKKVWRDNKTIFDSEIRFMDLVIHPGSDDQGFFLITGCSDGFLRVLNLTMKHEKATFALLTEEKVASRCILKMTMTSNQVLACTTDGNTHCFHFKNGQLNLNRVIISNGSGINSALIHQGLVITGDDGGSISISNLETGSTWSKASLHSAHVTGLSTLDPSHFISVSVDQRISVWNLHPDRQQLTMVKQTCTDVADIQDLTTWLSSDGAQHVAVVGLGLAHFSISQL